MRFPRLAASLVALASASIAVACATSQDAGDDAAQDENELRDDAGRLIRDAAPDTRTDAARDGGPDAPASSTDFVDARDGKRYATLQIGDKTWLARNLDFAIAGSSFCYGDDPANCAKDGRLYTFTAARTACAPGWHLGTDDDWKSLEAATGMAQSQLGLEGYSTLRGTNEGTKLKAAAGFGARMAGFRAGTSYEALGNRTYFWTATMRGGDVWRRKIAAADATVFRFTNPPSTFAISVRCVKD